MKLISLNVEGSSHTEKVFNFLSAESADVVCLQEATPAHQAFLEAAGYQVSFEPRCIKEYNGTDFVEGLLLASKVAGQIKCYCYYKPGALIEREIFDIETERNPTPRHILIGTFEYECVEYTIATTHFTWTKNGDIACDAQVDDFKEFKKIVTDFPPHLMCGDFNIPRHRNRLYADLTEIYRDEIPDVYHSSLDKDLHRMQSIPDQKEKLDYYMVDYVFQTGGYQVDTVRLQFGVSDHAAVVAEVGRGW